MSAHFTFNSNNSNTTGYPYIYPYIYVSGYNCLTCGTWVPGGTFHACGNGSDLNGTVTLVDPSVEELRRRVLELTKKVEDLERAAEQKREREQLIRLAPRHIEADE